MEETNVKLGKRTRGNKGIKGGYDTVRALKHRCSASGGSPNAWGQASHKGCGRLSRDHLRRGGASSWKKGKSYDLNLAISRI
jgi:hypothetical protein